MSGANVERSAIPELAAGLYAYVRDMTAAQGTVARRVDDARRMLTQRLQFIETSIERAEQELTVCRRDPYRDCYDLTFKLDGLASQREQVRGLERDVESALHKFRGAEQRFGNAIAVLNEQAHSELRRASEALDTYARASRSPATASASGYAARGARSSPSSLGAATSVKSPAGFPPGFAMVPLSLIDDSDSSVQSIGDFPSSFSAYDAEWALETFTSVIMPSLAAGATIADLRERDRRENRTGNRTLAATYEGFLGSQSIVLAKSGAGYEVVNGYHRIWAARRLGMDSIPVRASGNVF